MKKLFLILSLISLQAFAGNPTTYTIKTCEKVIDDKAKVTGVHIVITLSRIISNQTAPYQWTYELNLDATAVADLKSAIEVALKSGVLPGFNKLADAQEAEKSVPAPVVTKQAIDTSTLTLDLTTP